MKIAATHRNSFPRQAAVLILASAIGVPVWAQQAQPSGNDSSQSAPSAAVQQQQTDAMPTPNMQPGREGFWGRINPMARKKWVKKQTDPINDRLSELDQVNAQNAKDIKDVDSRAQAGIHQAQSAADAANQAALAAGQQAQAANGTAQQASNHVGQIGNTVNGLDQYKPVTDADLAFRPGSVMLTADDKQKLDQIAANLTGHQGYIIEIDAQAPGAGNVGIQSSQQLAEAVKRYLVTDHQIPVYRMHALALGNVEVAQNNDPDAKPTHVKARTVHVQVMENSLAAQGTASPQSAVSSTGPVQ
jgi:outer membrane protein OmpA-like peptidoglycan-associated protein